MANVMSKLWRNSRMALRETAIRGARSLSCDLVRKPRPLLERPDRELEISIDMVAGDLTRRSDRPPFFIQVGANDGVLAEPFLDVARRFQWHGILVEPQPEPFERLTKSLAGIEGLACVQAAVDRQDGIRKLYRIRAEGYPEWVYGLASFDRNHIVKHEAQVPGISNSIEAIDVPLRTFSDLLHDAGRESFDVLQVDTEGFDDEIVSMCLDARCSPSLINFEHKHLNLAKWNAVTRRLIEEGYKVARTGQDTLAYRPPRDVPGS